MTNKKLLRSKLILAEMTDGELAEKLGISRQSVSLKLNGRRPFNSNEISKIAHILQLTPEEVMQIFFDNNVDD